MVAVLRVEVRVAVSEGFETISSLLEQDKDKEKGACSDCPISSHVEPGLQLSCPAFCACGSSL